MAIPNDELLASARTRLRETAGSIATLLAEDLETYPERELQRRFVEAEGADKLSDQQLAALRKSAKELGKSFAEQVGERLTDEAPWLALAQPGAPLPEDRKTLRGVSAVWSVVSAIDAEVEKLAASAGLPADQRAPAGYSPPARFISRLHLPTLVENYFREVMELRKLGDIVAVEDAEGRRRNRAERWGAAE